MLVQGFERTTDVEGPDGDLDLFAPRSRFTLHVAQARAVRSGMDAVLRLVDRPLCLQDAGVIVVDPDSFVSEARPSSDCCLGAP